MNKRQQLIEQAFQLFYKQGIHAVGINQILKQAKVAKKTLYSHFESKEALVEAVLAYRDERFLAWLDKRMTSVESGRPALLNMFDALDDWFNNRVPTLANFHGCFFINTCSEYGNPESTINQLCQQHKLRVRALINSHVKQLHLKQDENMLTDSLVLLKEGAIVTAQVQADKTAAIKAKLIAEQLLSDDASLV